MLESYSVGGVDFGLRAIPLPQPPVLGSELSMTPEWFLFFVSSDLPLDCLAVPSRPCLGDYCSSKEDGRRKGVHRGQRQRTHKPGMLVFLYREPGAILVTLGSDMTCTTTGIGLDLEAMNSKEQRLVKEAGP